MRTTITFDEDLLKKAQAYTGLTEKSALVHKALEALIHQESSRRLARLSGSMPGLQDIPRRQSDAA
jgi:Arc/MetJ family transcription regulator